MNSCALRFCLLAFLCCWIQLQSSDEDPLSTGGSQTVESDGMNAAISSGIRLPRPDAPLPITITIRCDGLQARTGQLNLTVFEGDQQLLTWRSPDWTVTSTGRTQEVLLPPLNVKEDHLDLNAQLQWIEGEQVSGFPTLRLTSAGNSNRPLVMAYCASPGVDRKALIEATSLAKALGGLKTKDWQPDTLSVTETMTADRLPSDPLTWCAYEVVVLGGDAIALLSPHQLAGLLTWVKGGGSLAILPGSACAATVDAFLAQAGLSTSGDPARAGATARLEYLGLGRLAIQPIAGISSPGPADAGLALFLWKVQVRWQAQLGIGHLDPAVLAKTDVGATYRYYRTGKLNYNGTVTNVMPSFVSEENYEVASGVGERLMPKDIALVPFSLVALIIVIFALAVGPGDWLLLGRLKAHRFTWILFPALSVLTTAGLMLLADHYLGGGERRLRLAILDTGAQGAVLRCDVIESVFSGHAGPVAVQLRQALWAPMSNEGSPYSYRRRAGAENLAPPAYSGALPASYSASKDVAQWAPSLRRTFSFVDPGDCPVTLPDGLTQAQVGAFAAALAVHVPGVYAVSFSAQGRHDLCGTSAILDQPMQHGAGLIGAEQWLDALCIARKTSWFTLASQISPCGGNTFDDIPVYDDSDTGHWLLVAAVRQHETIYVVRRLYQTNGTIGTNGKEALP